MYDIKPLEEQWLRYRAKKRKPWYIFFGTFMGILLVISFLFRSNSINMNIIENAFTRIKTLVDANTHLTKKYNNNFTLLNGSIEKLDTLESSTSELMKSKLNSDTNATSGDVLVDIPILDEDGENIVNRDSSVHKRKVHLDISETTSSSAYKDVEKRFYQSGDIVDALFLAKSYYKRGDYNKAEQWAFEANQIDDTLEESFLIFVKSKLKLGQKNEATSILNQYLKHVNSKDARDLLEKIKN